MLGSIHTDFLVTVTLLFLSQIETQCRAENNISLVTLPGWNNDAEYVAQCLFDRDNNLNCGWTSGQHRTDNGAVDILESGILEQGKSCLEFWYLATAAANASEVRALLKTSTGLEEIWTSPVVSRDSWRQVFLPLHVTTSGSRVVLEAEMSTERQITFNHIGIRRGSCGPQCDNDTELWTDETTRCLCAAGHFSCSPSLCPQGQCGPQRGSSRGISNPGTCTIHSNSDCSTFDGVLFRFMAPCTYTLAKTCSPTETLHMFSVEVVNEHNANSSLPRIQQVNVNIGNFRMLLLRGQTHRAVVNGIWMKLPLDLSGGEVNIRSNVASVTLEASFGLLVSYDNAGAVHISLPSTYSDQVCGLCGNFNHLGGDDYTKSDGTLTQDLTALAESWQSGENTNSSCETILVPHHCDPVEESEYASEWYCGSLLSTHGPFSACQAVLEAESYFRGCVAGMCSTHGDSSVLCEALQIYADICHDAGIAVPMWRNSTFCSFKCGKNSHYNSCAEGCPSVCSSSDLTGSCGSCEERCECESGFKLSGGKCVQAEDCGCWHNGNHYEKGATFVKGECKEHCRCMGNNNVACTAMQCSEDEVCKVKGSVKGCFPFQPVTCSVYGDPHYITYDGMAYDFQGGCSYTLTTTCAGESPVEFTVTGHNAHPPLQNFTRSKLQAVTLEAEDLHITLNQNGYVYLNKSHIKLPKAISGTYGMVWVYEKSNYIVLETSFGLRMMIDGQGRLFLQVDERYMYELCGLCGTFSERQDDDFIMPGGQKANTTFEFGDSWRVQDNTECLAYPSEPKRCDYDEENAAYDECYTLLGDAFKSCHEIIHPSIYLSSCVYDYCATSGDQHTLCESLTSYAAACQIAEVELPQWQTNTACASPQTTPTLPTTRPPTSPTPDQTICPLNCNFDKNLCGWEQLVQDSFDWTRNSGPTPSQQTGPNQDHTTHAGFYMYIEGDSVTHGDSARLLSSKCHYSGALCLQFWYHMYGSATAMALNLYLLTNNKAVKLWSRINNQGPEWYPENVDINVSGPFQIIVEGIRGSSALSDVAIDDISIHYGSCSGSFPDLASGTRQPLTTAEVLPSHSVCSVDCNFDRDLCSWSQMMTDSFDWTWQSGSTPTLITGPSADHSGDGHYLYIEASHVTHGDTARLISSECSYDGPQCLQFWYHMHGSADTMGLHVYLLQGRVADAIWWKRNDQGNTWHMAQVDFMKNGPFQIIIEGRRGSNEESDVAIDDIMLFHGQCSDLTDTMTTSLPKPGGNTTTPPNDTVLTTAAPDFSTATVTAQSPVTAHPPAANVTLHPAAEETTTSLFKDNVTRATSDTPTLRPVCPLHCNFENNLCQWNQLLADVFDWTRNSGPTPTMRTGPSSDHTTGDGHYLYIEANSATYGDTARLISLECSDSGPQCLQFWYHMYGSAHTMGLHVYLLEGRNANGIWWRRNDQGNLWHLAQVDFTSAGPFQILFEGRRGSNDESDVAIDDVTLYHGHCADLVQPSTTPPAISTTTQDITDINTETPTKPTIRTTEVQPLPQTTEGPKPPTTQQPSTSAVSHSSTTARPHSSTPTPQLPTTKLPPSSTAELTNTDRPQPPTTNGIKPSSTAPTQPPTTDGPKPSSTAQPLPPTTEGPKPSSTAQPEKPTTEGPRPSSTARPLPPTTEGPKPSSTAQPEKPTTEGPRPSTARPQPQTTEGPKPSSTARPLPPTTEGPKPSSTAQPEKPTTEGPRPSTARPQPQTTEGPKPSSTARPLPPTTVGPKPSSTAQPEKPTTEGPRPSTARPQPQTTEGPKPSSTARPLPPTTEGPKPSSTAQPEKPTTEGPRPSTARPQPQTTEGPKPSSTARPLPPTTEGPKPSSTALPEKPTTEGPRPSTARPQPQTTEGPKPSSTARPEPPNTEGPNPSSTTQPQPPITEGPKPSATARPEPPTTEGPKPSSTARPEPQTTEAPKPSSTAQPEPPATEGPNPSSTAWPQPPITEGPKPSSTARPEPPKTEGPSPSSTTRPEPSTTEGPKPSTARPETPATEGPNPSSTARPQPPITEGPKPSSTAQPELTTAEGPKTVSTARPKPPATSESQPSTTNGLHPSTSESQSSTTARPHSTTSKPQPPSPTTEGPKPSSTARPEPLTTEGPKPPMTSGPQPTTTTAGPQASTTFRPQTTTATPQATTTSRPLSPTTNIEPPSCPKNSHYTTCIPACNPTCAHLNGPSHCSENTGCEQGCVCNDGYVLKKRVCVPIQQCGCVDKNGNKYNFNQVWYTSHCSQKCECEEDDGVGKIECDDEEECDGDAVCLQNEEGQYYCQSTGFSECKIKGDPEYKTFDQLKHDFDGEHSYVLVQTSNLPSNIPDVYIEAVNRQIGDDESSSEEDRTDMYDDTTEDDDDSEEEDEHNRLHEIKMRVYNHTVVFKKNRKLIVNGKRTNTPVSPTPGLNIRKHSSNIYLTTDFGLSVKFDGHSDAEITLPRIYRRKVGGLCGNFDGRKINDLMKPDGSIARTVQEFGNSWKV